MHDFVAYLTAQQLTAELAHEARPDAPVVEHRASRFLFLRSRISLALRLLADLVEPPAQGRERMAIDSR